MASITTNLTMNPAPRPDHLWDVAATITGQPIKFEDHQQSTLHNGRSLFADGVGGILLKLEQINRATPIITTESGREFPDADRTVNSYFIGILYCGRDIGVLRFYGIERDPSTWQIEVRLAILIDQWLWDAVEYALNQNAARFGLTLQTPRAVRMEQLYDMECV